MLQRTASTDIHHHNWVTYLLSRFFLRTRERKISYKLYTYLRHVDDFIDESGADQDTCLRYINTQRTMVKELYENGKAHSDSLLGEIIAHDRQNGRNFHECIELMMDVFEFDARRKHVEVPEPQLRAYSLNLARAYTRFLVHFIAPGYQHTENDIRLAHACHLAHMIRDLSIDNDLGYINIAQEDIEHFGLQPGTYTNGKYSRWLKKEIEYIGTLMTRGKRLLCKNRILTVKLMGLLYCFRYEVILHRITSSGFHLCPDYRIRLHDGMRLVWQCVTVCLKHWFECLGL
jgi:phytoene/squalene synthetase